MFGVDLTSNPCGYDLIRPLKRVCDRAVSPDALLHQRASLSDSFRFFFSNAVISQPQLRDTLWPQGFALNSYTGILECRESGRLLYINIDYRVPPTSTAKFQMIMAPAAARCLSGKSLYSGAAANK